jgi:hypothetical protein
MDREDQLNQIWTFPIEELQRNLGYFTWKENPRR